MKVMHNKCLYISVIYTMILIGVIHSLNSIIWYASTTLSNGDDIPVHHLSLYIERICSNPLGLTTFQSLL